MAIQKRFFDGLQAAIAQTPDRQTERIESVVWAQNKIKTSPSIQPRALSITQGRCVGLAHYLLGGIGTTWSFFHARIISVG